MNQFEEIFLLLAIFIVITLIILPLKSNNENSYLKRVNNEKESNVRRYVNNEGINTIEVKFTDEGKEKMREEYDY